MPPTLPAALHTERLTLRPIDAGDLEFFIGLHADPDVMRFMSRGGATRSAESTREWFGETLARYAGEGTGPYAIVRKADGRVLGRSGLSLCELELRSSTPGGLPRAEWGRGNFPGDGEAEPYIEVGYVVHPEFQGNGYATEAAARWMRYLFEERGASEAISLIHAANAASLRVAEKNGLARFRAVLLEGEQFAALRRRR